MSLLKNTKCAKIVISRNQKLTFSKRINLIKPSSTMSLTSKANEMRASGEDIIVLTVGEPDFDTPQYIKDAGLTAIQSEKQNIHLLMEF